MCKGGNTTTQSQTYTPNPAASGAINASLQQAQGVAQTPFQTPVAPVADFSQDQGQAFQNTRDAQGKAQPYLDQAQDYFSGNRTADFFNPFANQVMGGLKDIFGQQMQETTGNLTKQAGGVGADRIAVGQSELARQQGLAGGQTLANLYQPSLSAAQNAGFGIGALGPVAQNAQLQGAQALLGTGGLQQQLSQAQMNAPYQNKLAQIAWPYQNAQFGAGITGALAPGLGGTTNGNTTYPQQSPWGTIAGLGAAGAGLYGYGNQQGWFGSNAGTGGGSGSGGGSARGGRINPYAEGGAVDDNPQPDSSMDDQIRQAEIRELQGAGGVGPAVGGMGQGASQPNLPSGLDEHPIDVAPQSIVPTGQTPQIQPHIPQLQQSQQSGSGSGSGGMGDIVKMAATILPLLSQGGRVNPYADGGAVDDSSAMPESITDKVTRFMGIRSPKEVLAEPIGHTIGRALETAFMGGKPMGLRVQLPSGQGVTGRPMLFDNVPGTRRSVFASHARPLPDRPRNAYPGAAATAIAGNELAGQMGHGPPAPQGDSFDDRFSSFQKPIDRPLPKPLFMESGQQEAPPAYAPPAEPSNPFVPTPRPRPAATAMAAAPASQPKAYLERLMAMIAASEAASPRRMGAANGHYAEGGEVEAEDAPPSRALPDYESRDPNELAMIRLREGVRPSAGRADFTPEHLANMATAVAGSAAAPEYLALRGAMAATRYAPKVAASLYGLGATLAPSQAGEETFKWNDPDPERGQRLQKLDTEIEKEATRKTPSAAGTQKARLDSLNLEKTRLLDERGKERDAAMAAWQESQARAQAEAAERKKAETSLFDKIPGTRAALTAASPLASYVGGKYLGRRMSPYAAVPISATAGAVEGAGSIAGPTEMDINSLPRTSETRQQAEADLGKQSYWQRVLLAAGVGAGAGALGATKGFAKEQPLLSKRVAATPDAIEKAIAIAKTPPKIIQEVKLPDGSIARQIQLSNGRKQWRKPTDKGHGPIISDPTANALPPPAAMQAAGGRVGANPYAAHFADGGEVDPTDFGDRFGDWQATNKKYGRKVTPGLESWAPDDAAVKPMAAPAPTDDSIPSGATSTVGANPYADIQGDEAPQGGGKKSSFIDSPWAALMQAGLGTMAAAGQRDARGLPTQPFAAIGQGGMQGMKHLQQQQEAQLKQQTVEQRAKQLEVEAARHMRQMTETERHNREAEGRNRELIDVQKQRFGSGLFDQETVKTMAEQALRGDKSVFANLGRGVSGPQNIVAVRDEMNRQAKAAGIGGADIAALNANFAAQNAAARTAAVREANISTAVEEAKGTFPLALKASNELPRTDFVPVNKIIQAYRTQTSTPAQAQFAIAHQGVITAYSQAMSRTGVNTVHAQQRAEDAFSQVQSHEAYQAAIRQLELEMDVAKRAPETARQMILDRISGKQTVEEKPAATAAKPPEVGEVRTNKNGVKGKWNGTGWEIVQ